MWTTENRRRYDRDKLRYPSDLTDEEWHHIEPLIPRAKRGCAKRAVAALYDATGTIQSIFWFERTECRP
jgi:transposase